MRVAASLALAMIVACRHGAEEAYAGTIVSLRMSGGTLGELFKRLELQTGFPVRPGCDCGRLQELLDERVTLVVQGVTARQALILATAPMLSGHCGSWSYEPTIVRLRCGLRR